MTFGNYLSPVQRGALIRMVAVDRGGDSIALQSGRIEIR